MSSSIPPIIRLAQESDADRLLEIYAPVVKETAISFELAPPDVAEFRERVRSILASHNWLVIEEAQTILGYAYASKFRAREAYQWTAEVTVYVDPAHRKRGFARALYGSLFEALRFQGFCSVVAVIALPNLPSVRLHEKLGFEPVGVLRSVGYKLGRWHDVGWWQLKLHNDKPDPVSPRPASEFTNTSALNKALAAGVSSLKQ
jgi:L-amino acid N-acyltransferase YncA